MTEPPKLVTWGNAWPDRILIDPPRSNARGMIGRMLTPMRHNDGFVVVRDRAGGSRSFAAFYASYVRRKKWWTVVEVRQLLDNDPELEQKLDDMLIRLMAAKAPK